MVTTAHDGDIEFFKLIESLIFLPFLRHIDSYERVLF